MTFMYSEAIQLVKSWQLLTVSLSTIPLCLLKWTYLPTHTHMHNVDCLPTHRLTILYPTVHKQCIEQYAKGHRMDWLT